MEELEKSEHEKLLDVDDDIVEITERSTDNDVDIFEVSDASDRESQDKDEISEEINDFQGILSNVELTTDSNSFVLEVEKRDVEDLHSIYHDESVNNNSNCNSGDISRQPCSSMISNFNFKVYEAPPLLCRHPPPYTERDDDETKLREILDDILLKSDQPISYEDGQNRILFAPDHKIGKNILALMNKNSKYHVFLPGFPILHLRKSRICNIFSGYKNARLVHLIKYMRENNTEEWSKLLSERCIDDATTVIWRIRLFLRLAFLLRFIIHLPTKKQKDIIKDLDEKNYTNLLSMWDADLKDFIEQGRNTNATFALHQEMMIHCDKVLAMAFSERLGGDTGCSLLLGAVKMSLPFAFLNGASSYASFTTQLLHEHFTACFYHQKMKMSLYSTPHKFGSVNFGLDSQREMDHRDVVKGFRSGSSMKSIIPRMSIIDELTQAQEERKKSCNKASSLPFSVVSKTDMKHIIPTAELIVRRKGLEYDPNIIPYNVYAKRNTAILDTTTFDIGKYLIKKYIASESLFGYSKAELPKADEIIGLKPLVDRVKSPRVL